jgi:hypothetical protein
MVDDRARCGVDIMPVASPGGNRVDWSGSFGGVEGRPWMRDVNNRKK